MPDSHPRRLSGTLLPYILLLLNDFSIKNILLVIVKIALFFPLNAKRVPDPCKGRGTRGATFIGFFSPALTVSGKTLIPAFCNDKAFAKAYSKIVSVWKLGSPFTCTSSPVYTSHRLSSESIQATLLLHHLEFSID